VTGHLRLVCAADAHGRSFLREQSFCAPMHISKPFLDEDTLVVNVVNPTAGLFAGDEGACDVRVEPGARMLLTAPSASRVHRMKSVDGIARVRQEFSVLRGGFLEALPELFIPQGGARHAQQTRIAVEPGGELLFFELLAPGRAASGEVFAFSRLDWETDIFLGPEKIARERYRLSPADESLHTLRTSFASGAAYYASCFAIGERFTAEEADVAEQIHKLHCAGAWVGCSRLARGGCVIKLIAENSLLLREKLRAVRAILYAALERRPPALRRF
jgi:urease accessory protein